MFMQLLQKIFSFVRNGRLSAPHLAGYQGSSFEGSITRALVVLCLFGWPFLAFGSQCANTPNSTWTVDCQAWGVRIDPKLIDPKLNDPKLTDPRDQQLLPLGQRSESGLKSPARPLGQTVTRQPIGLFSELQQRVAVVSDQVAIASRLNQIDPLLVHAVIYVESRFRPGAVSRVGALGLMQVMPATGKRYGIRQAHEELTDATRNIDTGVAHLAMLNKLYQGDLSLVLAAYNAGEGAVKRYGNRVPPFAETQAYVRDVTALYMALQLAVQEAAQ
jgi:hypothetical protein